MKMAELRQLTEKKLWATLRASRRELAVAKFHVKTGQEQDTSKIAKKRKMIAQVLTLLNHLKNSK